MAGINRQGGPEAASCEGPGDELMMVQALAMAHAAKQMGEVPVGRAR